MPFQTIFFGTINITAPGTFNYEDGESISTGGLRIFLVPKVNVGSNGIDVGIRYINQFGVEQETYVTTAISAYTTAGTHIQMVLNAGDSGVRDVIGISKLIGGSPGDQLSLESWNEGLGRPPVQMSSTIPFDGSHLFEVTVTEYKSSRIYPKTVLPPLLYANPKIEIPIAARKGDIAAFLPDLIVDRGMLADSLFRFLRSEWTQWIPEPVLKEYTGKRLYLFKTWLESVVGQVLSGYVTNLENEPIKNAILLVVRSTTPTEISPGGTSDIGNVNPETGLYQIFLKKVVYDKRYLIVQVAVGKTVALEGAGLPEVVDGTRELPIPYNLQFACPALNCDFNITRKSR